MPMPLNFRELGRSSAQAACTKKIDRNDRALLKFNSFSFFPNSLDVRRKIFSVLANFKTFIARYNGRAAHSETPHTLEFAASFLTHI
jgi:hypothetical protein